MKIRYNPKTPIFIMPLQYENKKKASKQVLDIILLLSYRLDTYNLV